MEISEIIPLSTSCESLLLIVRRLNFMKSTISLLESVPFSRKIIHGYGEDLLIELKVYPLEEIIIEKLKAILSNFEKLHERGWTRSRVRDYYDLCWIFKRYKQDLNLHNFKENFHEKYPDTKRCFLDYRRCFLDYSDFFKTDSIAQVTNTWDQWLSPLQHTIPSPQEVIEDLKTALRDIFPGRHNT